jgi:acetoin utilization deacetylase AcuC-like enzyme
MTLLFNDPLFQRHETGRHPECPERLKSIEAKLRQSGLSEKCRQGSVYLLPEPIVRRMHAPVQVDRVKQMARQSGGMLDPDTVVSPASFEVALAAAGTGVAAVNAIMQGPETNALCLVRPPGHHATPTQSMGFCLFNNIALGALHALQHLQVNRILIVDFDVHHGNGTQDFFYEDPRVLFYSIHRYGLGFYPGTGAALETGSGPGLGFTVNAPIAYGTARKEYQDRFTAGLEKATSKIKPELVLVSAGFDAHVLDPVGSLGLEAEDFRVMTRQILGVAREHSKGKLVCFLEGGYHLGALAESVQIHLEELIKDSGAQAPEPS